MMSNEFPPLIYVDIKRAALPSIRRGRPQRWYWVAKSADNQEKLARSSERYTNHEDCLAAIAQLFGSGTNVYLREQEQGNQVLRMATP